MESEMIAVLMNNGAMGAMLVWFMFKNSKDQEMNREALTELKSAIFELKGAIKQ